MILFCISFDNSTGYVYLDGDQGWGGNVTGDRDEGCSGGGGGGAAGLFYLECLEESDIGENRIYARGGAGGPDAGPGSMYPNHGGGGSGGSGFCRGTNGGNQHSARYSGAGGAGGMGFIRINGPFTGITTSPNIQ